MRIYFGNIMLRSHDILLNYCLAYVIFKNAKRCLHAVIKHFSENNLVTFDIMLLKNSQLLIINYELRYKKN